MSVNSLRIGLLSFFLFLGQIAFAQIDWDLALNKTWEINSAGYPHEDKELDELYHRIFQFKMVLNSQDNSFKIEEPIGQITVGTYELRPLKAELVLKTNKNEQFTFHFIDLNTSVMILQGDKNVCRWWYLNLATH